MADKKITDVGIVQVTALVGTELVPFAKADASGNGKFDPNLIAAFSNGTTPLATSTTLVLANVGKQIVDVNVGVDADKHTITLPDISTVNVGDTFYLRSLRNDEGFSVAAYGSDTMLKAPAMAAFDGEVASEKAIRVVAFPYGGSTIWVVLDEAVFQAPDPRSYAWQGWSGSDFTSDLYDQILLNANTTDRTLNLKNGTYGCLLLNPHRCLLTFTKDGDVSWLSGAPSPTKASTILVFCGSGTANVWAVDQAPATNAGTPTGTDATVIQNIIDCLVANGFMSS